MLNTISTIKVMVTGAITHTTLPLHLCFNNTAPETRWSCSAGVVSSHLVTKTKQTKLFIVVILYWRVC